MCGNEDEEGNRDAIHVGGEGGKQSVRGLEAIYAQSCRGKQYKRELLGGIKQGRKGVVEVQKQRNASQHYRAEKIWCCSY